MAETRQPEPARRARSHRVVAPLLVLLGALCILLSTVSVWIRDAALDTEAELLAEIARQRRYELYEQGLRWEDTRRFGTALTTVPTIPFLPIPQQECNANPQRICD